MHFFHLYLQIQNSPYLLKEMLGVFLKLHSLLFTEPTKGLPVPYHIKLIHSYLVPQHFIHTFPLFTNLFPLIPNIAHLLSQVNLFHNFRTSFCHLHLLPYPISLTSNCLPSSPSLLIFNPFKTQFKCSELQEDFQA